MPKIINKGNWSLIDPGDDIPDGSTINGGNFSQLLPDTPILVGKTLTINGGNFTNARIDAAWTMNGGNRGQIDRCFWLNPNLALATEVENCRHVIEIDTITIDSVLISTVYQREDTVL